MHKVERAIIMAAGMSQNLTESLTQEDCSIRFFLLDALGELEKILFAG